ncbi:MAG: tRNA (guanosine(37)-N1)-methyltransferase TrmD [Spirochaetales bacterium]|nr:tRNA (guanosine(37)-N1)-methyltransferase TrmD [Spirochaetales bacterium]
MRISLLSIFPESFDSFRVSSVVRKAERNGMLDLDVTDIRDYAEGSFRKIDDSPYGGGPGMVLRVDTVSKAIASVRGEKTRVVLLSPKGVRFDQKKAHEYAGLDHLVLVCGHYEGFDARVSNYVDEELSIGDFILTGGEIAAMAVCDSVVRLLDGSLRRGSADDESFETGLLEYPHYTHPYEFDGNKVPDVLLSGNHEAVRRWRMEKALEETRRLRPDLLDGLK